MSAGALSALVAEFVSFKRACGFKYEENGRKLARFVRMCDEMGLSTRAGVTREMAEAWAERLPGESRGTRAGRVDALRQFASWLAGRGVETYVPPGGMARDRPCVRVPSRSEVASLVAEADAARGPSGREWMAREPGCMIRLMWSCGLRLGECCGLRWDDVDLAGGAIAVRESKGGKSRTVWMAPDMSSFLAGYREGLSADLGLEPDWCFPGPDPSRHLEKTNFDRRFRQLWGKTEAGASGKAATPHGLRHAFVVERMNAWAEEGVELSGMMPYLSAYLGHSSPDETFYYYHQVAEAFGLVRKADSSRPTPIPEVVPYEP